MRRFKALFLIAVLAVATAAIGATGAHAATVGHATGDVTADRLGNGPFYLKFTASGNPASANGTFTYREPTGYTVSGKVTCFYEQGNRAVMTGPVTKEKNPDANTEALVVWVSAENPKAFDVAGTILTAAADCQNNFPLDRFDNPNVSYYAVTSGNIRVW